MKVSHGCCFHGQRATVVKQSASQNLTELVAAERPDGNWPAPFVEIGTLMGSPRTFYRKVLRALGMVSDSSPMRWSMFIRAS
jgi:hypothetical protein